MTCILALENGKTEEWVSASSYAASQPKVRMGVRKGEAVPFKGPAVWPDAGVL